MALWRCFRESSFAVPKCFLMMTSSGVANCFFSRSENCSRYLESVVAENEEEYEGEIENVLNRHQTLEQGNLELQGQDVQVLRLQCFLDLLRCCHITSKIRFYWARVHCPLRRGRCPCNSHPSIRGREQVNAELDKRREEFQRKVTELTNAQLMINSELHGHQMQLERLRHPSGRNPCMQKQ